MRGGAKAETAQCAIAMLPCGLAHSLGLRHRLRSLYELTKLPHGACVYLSGIIETA